MMGRRRLGRRLPAQEDYMQHKLARVVTKALGISVAALCVAALAAGCGDDGSGWDEDG
jgi:hypothetical protein